MFRLNNNYVHYDEIKNFIDLKVFSAREDKTKVPFFRNESEH